MLARREKKGVLSLVAGAERGGGGIHHYLLGGGGGKGTDTPQIDAHREVPNK